MRGLNKVTLIGNLGKDPDVQTLEGNIKVAKFSLATTDIPFQVLHVRIFPQVTNKHYPVYTSHKNLFNAVMRLFEL